MKLIKTVIIALMVGGLLLGSALPVLAANNTPDTKLAVSFLPEKGKDGKGRWFEGKAEIVRGEIKATSNNTITVDGKEIIVTLDTRYRMPAPREAGLANLKIGGQIVALVDKRADGKLYARQIIVIPGKPVIRHHVGELIAYTPSTNTTDGSITLKDKQGETTEFRITGGNFKILPPGAAVKVGDWVTVISRRYPAQAQPIALGVVVHPQRLFPRLEQVSGVIHVNTDNKTITVDTTPPVTLNYDDTTLFVLRGISAAEGQKATILYREQDSTKLAKLVLVGTEDMPKLKELLKGLYPEHEEHELD